MANRRLGVDGFADVTVIQASDCCPPSLCNLSVCWLQCNMIASLPTGPLWDEPKRTAISRLQCGAPTVADPRVGCTSIVAYAAAAAEHLHIALHEALWPSIRESHPATAVTTLDAWLERLGWQDCFRCACDCIDAERAERRPPYEIIMPDGQSICCPSEAPEGLTLAVKRGIAIALHRLRMGIVPRVDTINWVIEPLGAKVVALAEPSNPTCCIERFTITSTASTLPAVQLSPCGSNCAGTPPSTVGAFWLLTCDGEGDNRQIWPGVLAAECIVRSILAGTTYSLTRS